MTDLVLASGELSADLKFTFVLWSYSPTSCPPTSTYISEFLVLVVVFTYPNEYTKVGEKNRCSILCIYFFPGN